MESASAVSRKWLEFCCAKNGSGRGVRREHTRQRSVTDEQRSPEPFLPQPAGPQFFSTSTSLLAPYRPTQVCSSLAPRGNRKSLAAKRQPFARHYTRHPWPLRAFSPTNWRDKPNGAGPLSAAVSQQNHPCPLPHNFGGPFRRRSPSEH